MCLEEFVKYFTEECPPYRSNPTEQAVSVPVSRHVVWSVESSIKSYSHTQAYHSVHNHTVNSQSSHAILCKPSQGLNKKAAEAKFNTMLATPGVRRDSVEAVNNEGHDIGKARVLPCQFIYTLTKHGDVHSESL